MTAEEELIQSYFDAFNSHDIEVGQWRPGRRTESQGSRPLEQGSSKEG